MSIKSGQYSELPIGVVGNPWLGAGSGFLVSECHALTAFHVIGDSKIIGRRTSFHVRPWDRSKHTNRSRGTVIDAGRAPSKMGDYSQDWALIRLDSCLGTRFGFLPIALQGFFQMGGGSQIYPKLMSAGFPQDRGSRWLTIDPECRAQQATSSGMRHDCATLPGASGGALIAWNEALQRYEAIGITVAGFREPGAVRFRMDRANLAVVLPPIRGRIERAVEHDSR